MFDNSTHTFTSLECKKHVKYLGILLDSNLSWKFLIEYVALEISKIIRVITRLRHFVPLCTFLNIYCSLIFPYMPWLSCLGQAAKTHLQKLLVLQKRKTCPSFKSSSLSLNQRSYGRFGAKLWNSYRDKFRQFPKSAFKKHVHDLPDS